MGTCPAGQARDVAGRTEVACAAVLAVRDRRWIAGGNPRYRAEQARDVALDGVEAGAGPDRPWYLAAIAAASRADLIRRLRFLPLSKDLRQAFQSCNLGYLAAGHILEVLSGTPWEDYLRTRLLTPLKMDRSNVSVDDMGADPDHASACFR